MLASAPRTAPVQAAAAVSGSVLGPLRCSEPTKQARKIQTVIFFKLLFLIIISTHGSGSSHHTEPSQDSRGFA